MIRNYLKIAWRNLSRQKGFAIINAAGLATGIACCLLILLFVRHEVSFDRFHPNADRIYRVLRADSAATGIRQTANILGNLAVNIGDTFPTIEKTVRVHRRAGVVGNGEVSFDEAGFVWADPSIFSVFDFSLASGDPSTALVRPNTAVVTAETAKKYFGEEDPVGKSLTLNSDTPLEITGVVNPAPANSHIQFDILASMSTVAEKENVWAAENQGWTYILATPGTSPATLERQINASLDELVWWWNLDAMYVAYTLQPLTDIHLHSRGYVGIGSVGDWRYIYIFSAIALLILVIACINYMNLATARAARRAHEVGMRKTLGAQRRQIVGQFMSEAVLMSSIALLAALVLVKMALPYFNQLTEKQLALTFYGDAGLVALCVVVALLTGIVSGSYPAFYLSRFEAVRVLKGLRERAGTPVLRRGLVILQFAITIVLLVGTTVIYRQMRFVQNKNLGFDTEQVVIVSKRGIAGDPATFKQALEDIPGVVAVSAASGIPLQGGWVSESEFDGRKVMTMRLLVDEDYVATMGMTLAQGRGIDANQPSDRVQSLLINETMADARGWEDPLSQTITSGIDSLDNPINVNVVGVVRDFHTGSLHEAIMPTILDPNPKWQQYYRQFLVRVRPDDVAATLASLETTWKRFAPAYPFDFSFLDDDVNALYRSDQQLGTVLGSFTVIAIVIACLGLFGLAAYMAEQRRREIGIRKVLGASLESIVIMLSREFVALVLVAFAFAVPIAWLVAKEWLADFAYRVELDAWMFAGAGVAALVLSLVTVSYQAVRAGLSDPVKSLRYE